MNPDKGRTIGAGKKNPALPETRDGIPHSRKSVENPSAGQRRRSTPEEAKLIEHMVERENMLKAYRRVVSNKGSAGIDGMAVTELKEHINLHWSKVKEKLINGK
jgi:RNA-directed DNA polymerase